VRIEEESMTEADQVEEMLGQVLVVFGQGTGVIRIPRTTVAAIRDRYLAMKDRALLVWEKEAAEALDRVRIVGRLAAQNAVARGSNEVSVDDFVAAARTVEPESRTIICNEIP
jgi:hypothetical protein